MFVSGTYNIFKAASVFKWRSIVSKSEAIACNSSNYVNVAWRDFTGVNSVNPLFSFPSTVFIVNILHFSPSNQFLQHFAITDEMIYVLLLQRILIICIEYALSVQLYQ